MEQTYFVTSETAQRTMVFQSDRAADLFMDVLLGYRRQQKYLLHEFVLMPDRFHGLITPAPEVSLERAVHFIKGGFSFRLKSSVAVWQARFTNHGVRDREDFERYCEFIWASPVRSGLASKREDYLFSSAGGRYELDPAPERLTSHSGLAGQIPAQEAAEELLSSPQLPRG
ncbi:MAG: transposase [Terriglobales bacterium]